MRSKLIIAVLLGVCCALIAALTNHVHIEKHIEASEAALREPIASFECDKMPLSDAIDMLQRKTTQHIFVRWEKLSEYGVERNSPVTLSLKNVKLSGVLEWMMAEFDNRDRRFAYRVEGNTVIFSTVDDLKVDPVVRMYDVSDLIAALRKAYLSDVAPQGGSGSTGPPATLDLPRVPMASIIEQFVEPNSWRDAGGSVGDIQEFDGILIITTTPDGQRRVAGLLAQMRYLLTAKGPISPPLSFIEPPEIHEFPSAQTHLSKSGSIMNTPVADLVCDHVTLTQALGLLRKASGVNIVVDSQAAHIQDVDAAVRISLHVKNVELQTALSMLMDYAPTIDHLTWSERDGVVWISQPPVEFAGLSLPTWIYDVRDLCAASKGANPDVALLDTIVAAMDPNSPNPPGAPSQGFPWTGTAFAGHLFITTTPDNQRRIEEMLAAMRASAAKPSTQPFKLDLRSAF